MPIYEYVCSDCGNMFEYLVLGSNDNVCCPKCGKENLERKMSAFAYKSGTKFVSSSNKASCAGCTATSCSTCH